ncbi:MAG: ABC transporter ATP-binding protein [Gammaproteobacteria bacterium]|nr:ABC transporter ATP-binding protein [Gammaproteobacteria bacterium]MDX2458475.1 ABC transporter ATP-binding protein [Gammaproteobacteria bacterium]
MTAAEDNAAAARYGWSYLLGIAREHRRTLVIANVIAVVAVLFAIPIPLLMPLLVDEVLLGRPGMVVATLDAIFPSTWHGPVLYVCAVLVLTVLLRLTALTFAALQVREFTCISKNMVFHMRRELLGRLERISMAEYETMGSGGVASHFVTDMNAIDNFVGTTVAKFLISVLSLIGTAAVLLWMHWPLALFILFMNPIVVYLTIVLGKGVKELKRRENAAFEVFQESLTETLDVIQTIRAANREQHYLQLVAGRARDVRDHGVAFTWKSETASRLSFMIFLVGFDIFRAVSMLLVVFSDLSVGQMMAVFGYLWFMMGPVQEVLNIQFAWYGAKAALARINRLWLLHAEPQYPHEVDPFRGKATVSVGVHDLCFAYGQGPLVLDHLSLGIGAGEKVALVGASGGGKSTLVQVMLGLYLPLSGELRFEGVPVTRIGLDIVREHVAVVLQHPALLNDSVRTNLSLGRDLDDGALWKALRVAQIDQDIAAMPRALDAIIGRQGIRLSGGQRQRLAIARMMLSDPKVVILDEATSALDTETEARLHEAMAVFLAERTTLIIAHRLSAVKQANRVYVFDAGRIIETGAHDTLMAAGGLYAKLYGDYQTA